MYTLLVIDDEESVRYSFRYVFEEEDVQVLSAATAQEGLALVQEHQPDVVVLDLQLPDRSGLEVFRAIHNADPKRPVIFITAHGTTETAIEAMKNGAFDYLVKPVDLEQVTQLLGRAFDASRMMRTPTLLPEQELSERIVGRTSIMQEMCKLIGRAAPQDVNVFIQGESGVGKELVARALYSHSRRADKSFLAINCAAIPEALLESELFGHEQGAFTGAVRRRIGKFEQCDGGTLFLDEIGDMEPALQAKILRVLQDQQFERLGGQNQVRTNVRVLAATNQNLDAMVQTGRFRKDLYYRLKGITIVVPPLRDRREDVAELAHYFLFRFNRELGRDLRGIAPEAIELLEGYAWPGNVRELQGILREAILNATGHILLPDFLPPFLRKITPLREPGIPVGLNALVEELLAEDGDKNLYERAIQALERVLLPRIMRETHGHQSQASERLGISRGTLRQKLRLLGLDRAIHDEPEHESTDLK